MNNTDASGIRGSKIQTSFSQKKECKKKKKKKGLRSLTLLGFLKYLEDA